MNDPACLVFLTSYQLLIEVQYLLRQLVGRHVGVVIPLALGGHAAHVDGLFRAVLQTAEALDAVGTDLRPSVDHADIVAGAYEAKDQLLREIEHEYLENTRRLTRSLYDFRADAPKEQADVFLKELTADIEYHRENAQLCRLLLSPAGDLYFRQKMINSLVETVQKNLQKQGKFDDRDVHYRVNYFVSGYIATVYEWLLREDRTPEQIAGFLLDMMKQFMP